MDSAVYRRNYCHLPLLDLHSKSPYPPPQYALVISYLWVQTVWEGECGQEELLRANMHAQNVRKS